MAYTLGDITLPNPQEFSRDPIKLATRQRMLDGTSKEDVIKKKWAYTLVYRRLTQAEVNSILSEYNKDQAVYFAVSETNLTITSRLVLIDIQRRSYNKGGEYREDTALVLEEVA